MAKTDFSTDLKKECRKSKVTVHERAFADLMSAGWSAFDAYVASGLANPALSIEANLHEMEALREKAYFSKFYNERIELFKLKYGTHVKEEPVLDLPKNTDYRSKDFIISELAKTAESLSGKERSDVLMKIADLQQMKKDDIREEEETIHFYLPVNCPKTCNLFKKP